MNGTAFGLTASFKFFLIFILGDEVQESSVLKRDDIG